MMRQMPRNRQGRLQMWQTALIPVEVTLQGGSGRASVDSPATIIVKDGKVTADIVWSSPNYEYMLVDDVQYDPIQTEGNSEFQIPVTLDEGCSGQCLDGGDEPAASD